MTPRACLLTAAIALALAVLLGAFGAHALKVRLPAEAMATYQTAVQYHFWHALGLLAIGVLWLQRPDWSLLAWAAWPIAAGIVLFSGSLYALAVSGVRSLGAITPFGGAAFVVGWLLFAYAILRA